jgi:hypothetical protein
LFLIGAGTPAGTGGAVGAGADVGAGGVVGSAAAVVAVGSGDASASAVAAGAGVALGWADARVVGAVVTRGAAVGGATVGDGESSSEPPEQAIAKTVRRTATARELLKYIS